METQSQPIRVMLIEESVEYRRILCLALDDLPDMRLAGQFGMLLAQGLVKKEIAKRLGIGYGTVDTHVSHIYAKLNVANAPAAVSRAYQLGLLSPLEGQGRRTAGAPRTAEDEASGPLTLFFPKKARLRQVNTGLRPTGNVRKIVLGLWGNSPRL